MNLRTSGLLLAFLAASPAVRAESATLIEGPDTVAVGEVNITAIKQARSLLRQPVTVTTIRQAELERLNVTGMKGMSELAPNFYMADHGSRMTSSIYVRGIGARIDQPAVGLNVDNVPYLNKNSYDFDLTDVERIEVLRGPQSTLFGRNTIAGLINIYTLSPLQWQGVRLMAEGALPGAFRLGASVLGRLTPELGMSLSILSSARHGYYRNDYNGKRTGAEDMASLRWKTVWTPHHRLRVENTLSVDGCSQDGYAYAAAETGRIAYNDTCFYERAGLTEGLTARWQGDNFTLQSITSFQYLSDHLTLDQDFSPLSYFTLSQRQHERAVTQEFVARGRVGAYSWLGGVFGFYKYGSIHAPVTFKEDGIERLILAGANSAIPAGMRLKCDTPELLLGSVFRQPVKGFALYHQSSYDIDHVTLALGLRFDYEKAELRYRSQCATAFTMYMGPMPLKTVPVEIDDASTLRQHFRQLLPKLSVTWNLTHSAFFASVAKGYKAGGYNTQMFSDFLQQKMMEAMGHGGGSSYPASEMVAYKPETSWNYEVGGHVSNWDGRANASFALFWIDLRNQQLTVFPGGTTTGRVMTNAGRSRSLGGEFSLALDPTPRWGFNVSYGYTRATFRRYDDGRADYSGCRVPNAPAHTLFVAARHTFPVDPHGCFRGVSLGADLRGAGSIYWDEANRWKQPFYAELGASVRLAFRDFTVDLWGKNLTKTGFDTFRYESVGHTFFQRGLPIRGGITVRLDLRLLTLAR